MLRNTGKFLAVMALQEDGSYAGFDEKELTSQSGGKAQAARLIKVPRN